MKNQGSKTFRPNKSSPKPLDITKTVRTKAKLYISEVALLYFVCEDPFWDAYVAILVPFNKNVETKLLVTDVTCQSVDQACIFKH